MQENKLSSENVKKTLGALVIAVLVCLFLIVILTFISFFIIYYNKINFLLIMYAALIICTIVGTVIVLVQRFREINSGEEDEARKY